MKNTKNNKGITIIALIITVVILLILATVAITSIRDTGIIEYANNAATSYKDKQDEEAGLLNGYKDILQQYTPSTPCTHQFNDGTCELCGYSCEHKMQFVEVLSEASESHFSLYQCSVCGITESVDEQHEFGTPVYDTTSNRTRKVFFNM